VLKADIGKSLNLLKAVTKSFPFIRYFCFDWRPKIKIIPTI
jgi:hypothetical protein